MIDTYLQHLDPRQPHILLMRHAERYQITSIQTSSRVLLTEKGKRDAFALGRRLDRRFGPVRLYHSPVERCAQTAERIRDGILAKGGEASLEGPLSWLGGDFIRAEAAFVDGRIAAEGINGFLRRWFDGELPGDEIADADRAARIELGCLHRQLDGREGLIVDVTHDWNLMLLFEAFLKLRHEAIGFPPYLACLVVTRSRRGGLVLEYEGSRAEADAGAEASDET
jgi:hypothetical protein